MRDKRISDCRFTARKRLIRKLKSMLIQHFYIFISLCLKKKKKGETKTVIGHMMENQSGLEVDTAIRALRVHAPYSHVGKNCWLSQGRFSPDRLKATIWKRPALLYQFNWLRWNLINGVFLLGFIKWRKQQVCIGKADMTDWRDLWSLSPRCPNKNHIITPETGRDLKLSCSLKSGKRVVSQQAALLAWCFFEGE